MKEVIGVEVEKVLPSNTSKFGDEQISLRSMLILSCAWKLQVESGAQRLTSRSSPIS